MITRKDIVLAVIVGAAVLIALTVSVIALMRAEKMF